MTRTKQTLLCAALMLGACNGPKPESGAQPVDAAATPQTVQLYRSLLRIPEKGFLFGHQDDTLYGVDWYGDDDRSDVKSVCGDYPALYGWEIGHIETDAPYSLDSVWFDTMRRRIVEAYERGGVNTVSWHADNPLTGGNTWDVSDTTVVASILPGGINHEKYLTWLDRTAAFLNSLETQAGEKVPILFRPYHEHMGSWFWWGRNLCTPEEYVTLFRFTVDYFKEKGVHNLLYVYSPDITLTPEAYFERYPGDDYVDVLGVDAYQAGEAGTESFVRNIRTLFDFLTQEGAARGKAIAFSETGLEALPMESWWTEVLLPAVSGYPLSYVLVWRNAYDRENHYYAPFPGQKSGEDFLRFCADERTLFESDIHEKMYE